MPATNYELSPVLNVYDLGTYGKGRRTALLDRSGSTSGLR